MKIWLWLPLLIAACAKPAGGPLKLTFDNTRIAAVPLEAKQPVTEAQQRHDVAQLDHKNTSTEHRDAEIEEDLAEYQAQKGVVVSQEVAARHAEAKGGGPDTAALSRKVADAKVAFMHARRVWLGTLSSWSLYQVYATQAKLELERAKVAQANNAAPGVDVAAFENQASAREKAAQTAKDAAEAERKNTEAKLAAWAESEKELLRTLNIQGPVESARYSAEWRSVGDKPGDQPAGPPGAQPAKADPPRS